MTIKGYIVILFVGVTNLLFAQLPSSVLKLAGEWKYKSSESYEVWSLDSDELSGYAYRMNKVGDTSIVEKITIKKVNKNLFYSLETYNTIGDSIIILERKFIGGKRKMKFLNIENNSPYKIVYSFGFLNRNRLKIRIQYNVLDNPIKLILNRVKD